MLTFSKKRPPLHLFHPPPTPPLLSLGLCHQYKQVNMKRKRPCFFAHPTNWFAGWPFSDGLYVKWPDDTLWRSAKVRYRYNDVTICVKKIDYQLKNFFLWWFGRGFCVNMEKLIYFGLILFCCPYPDWDQILWLRAAPRYASFSSYTLSLSFIRFEILTLCRLKSETPDMVNYCTDFFLQKSYTTHKKKGYVNWISFRYAKLHNFA